MMNSPEQNESPSTPSKVKVIDYWKKNWFYIVAFLYSLIILLQFSSDLVRAILWALLMVAAFLAIFSFILMGLWHIPRWQVRHIENLGAHDLFALENEARKTIAQVLGGLLLLISFYFTWANLKTTQDSAEKTQRIAQEGRITEQFSKAVIQLADERLQVRLGGIYALEQVSNDSDKYHWAVMELLIAHLHKEAPWPPKNVEEQSQPRADIQAILTVIGRRQQSYQNGESQRLDLRGTDLRSVNLDGANLAGVNLEGANLQGASLLGANLTSTNLKGVILTNAQLSRSMLRYAYLEGTIMDNAVLDGVNIDEVDLEKVVGLKWEQINRMDSRYRKQPKLPPDLVAPWRSKMLKVIVEAP